MDLRENVALAHRLCDQIEHFGSALREHQRETLSMLRGIATGMGGGDWPFMTSPGYVVQEIVPGGGKSYNAVMSASVLVGSGLVDVALWISPRVALMQQGKEDFSSTGLAMRKFQKQVPIFNPAGLIPEEFTPDKSAKFMRSQRAVWILSYQRMKGSADCLSHLVESKKVLLIFDEFQLLKDLEAGSGLGFETPESWFDLLDPMTTTCYQKTGLGGIILSGGLYRNDGKRLPRISYRQGDIARGEDPKKAFPLADTVYTLSEAQADRCLIKMDFDFYHGEVEFRDEGGEAEFQQLDEMTERCYHQKLAQFLDEPEVWQTIIKDMLLSLDYYNPPECGYRARYMVTSKLIKDAELHAEFLESLGRKPLLVHSGQSDAERKNLDKFRRGEGNWDGLVSVAIGYIGLSVYDLSHMAYLSHYRSTAWINQAFHRVTRFDPHVRAPRYEHQLARIFLPNDRKMRRLVEDLMACQNPGVVAMPPPPRPSGSGGGGPGPDFEAISATISGRKFSTNGEDCSEHDFVEMAVRGLPALNALPRKVVEQFKDLADRYREARH